MKFIHIKMTVLATLALQLPAHAQSEYEALLCEAAKTNRTVEVVYDKNVSKGCIPRLIDVHQVAIGYNGKLYFHGWQTRGCTKARDFEAERIFRFDKIKSVEIVEGDFNEKSISIKADGWDGCLGSNCFIEVNICE